MSEPLKLMDAPAASEANTAPENLDASENPCRYGPGANTAAAEPKNSIPPKNLRRYGPGSDTAPSQARPKAQNQHGYQTMSAREKAEKSQSQESVDRSVRRRADMNSRQRRLCEDIGESRHVWYQMRRHGSPKQVEEWLRLAGEHSTWMLDRDTPEESLRRQYVQLFQECRHYDPSFLDEEMRRRRGIVDV